MLGDKLHNISIKIGMLLMLSVTPFFNSHANECMITERYERKHEIQDLSQEGQPILEVIDFLEIEKLDENGIRFTYESVHANGHTCRLNGNAKLKNNFPENKENERVYIYQSELQTCIVNIIISPESASILDVDDSCGIASCGQRGRIGTDIFNRMNSICLTRKAIPDW